MRVSFQERSGIWLRSRFTKEVILPKRAGNTPGTIGSAARSIVGAAGTHIMLQENLMTPAERLVE